jgi:hypothetical protein
MVTVASWLTQSRPRPFEMSSASSAMFQWADVRAVEHGVQAVILLKSCSPSNVCQLGSRWSPAQAVTGVGRCGVVRHSRGHATAGRVLLHYQVNYNTQTRSAQVRSFEPMLVGSGYCPQLTQVRRAELPGHA